jgi:hypothetical protein
MKTTLDLPDELVKQVKLKALHEGKKLKEAFADAIRAGLAAEPKGVPRRRALMRVDRKTGLLVIRGSAGAPGRKMSIDDALALEREALLRGDLERAGISL